MEVAVSSAARPPNQPTTQNTLESADSSRGYGLRLNLRLAMFWDEEGQDIAEYAVMLAVILVIVIGSIKLIGSNANTAFSNVASAIL
jgi:Flp pilus assembly pilin Flp